VSHGIHLFDNDPRAVTAPAGSVLYRAGEPGDTMVGVISGEVDIVADGIVIETIGAGGIVGEMALIDGSVRSASAIARTEARLSVVDRERFERLISDHPTFALQVMRVMADRLRKANLERTASTHD
jgi:CRP/FNR family cyclic AMP-dependent transcriptional regulator